jgi:hypothetical protein
MPKHKPDADAALAKLGLRVRAGFATEHPAQHLDTVREAVRQQYEQERQAPRAVKPTPDADRGKQRPPPEPEPER